MLGGRLAACPEASLVGIFRHPFRVAESLHRRNGIDHEEGLELWLRYNRVLHRYRDNRPPFPLIEFSVPTAVKYRSGLGTRGMRSPTGPEDTRTRDKLACVLLRRSRHLSDDPTIHARLTCT